MFSALWASVWSKNKGGGAGPPGPSPGSATVMFILLSCKSICIVYGPNEEPIWAPALMFLALKGGDGGHGDRAQQQMGLYGEDR